MTAAKRLRIGVITYTAERNIYWSNIIRFKDASITTVYVYCDIISTSYSEKRKIHRHDYYVNTEITFPIFEHRSRAIGTNVDVIR